MNTPTPHKIKRPPIVAIMGHIDHGKSTLLSYIRKSAEPLREAGGITQRVSAYEVEHQTSSGTEKITFIDTPGHEAFSGDRVRGAHVADIAVLVVSAEDGVKPQTLEALKSIQESKTQYIVALSKTDKPDANIERTKQSLAENNIYVEGYGGNIPVVSVSGKTGAGVPELLDMIVLATDLESLTGNPKALAHGVIIESNLDVKKGISATGIITDGTMEKGMFIATSGSVAPLRAIENWVGTSISTATFSSPVKIIGWNTLPKVGDTFQTFKTKKEAEEYSNRKIEDKKIEKLHTAENQTIKTFPLVVKADAGGSLEAVIGQIKKLGNEKIIPHVIQSGIGTISENDIRSAHSGTAAKIIGFNVKIDSQAKTLAERDGVEIVIFDIIYKLTEWLTAQLIEHTPRVEMEEITGTAKVLKLFSKVKDKQIIGCRMEVGTILLGEQVKVIRRDVEIAIGKVRELQMQKQKVSAIEEGKEFGTMVEAKIEIAPGDKLQAVTLITK